MSSAVLSREEVFLLDNCDAFSQTLPRDEMDYRELDTFAKRAYNQVGICILFHIEIDRL